MPKKVLGVNSKAEEARARKAATEAERKAREASEKEEAYWREAEEGGKTRAAKKKEEDAARRAEATAKKAEAKKLAEMEAKEMDGKKKTAAAAGRVSIPAPKVTAAELALRREQEESRRQAEAEAARRRQLRVADPDDYARLLDAYANTNREDQLVDAHSLDTAIAQISLASSSELPVDRHPERRLKAAFKAFEEAELLRLKQEKPGLTHTQYGEIIWKLWRKSPDNPLNQGAQN